MTGMGENSDSSEMSQRDIQIWNDAVDACYDAAWKEVQQMEMEAADGMPNPARVVVREVGRQKKSGDERKNLSEEQSAALMKLFKESFPNSFPDNS